MSRRRWRDLSPHQRRVLTVTAVVEVVLTTSALTDLVRRPTGQVRGAKWLWALGCLVQPIGPVAYFSLGRR